MREMKAKMEVKIEIIEFIERRCKDIENDIIRYTTDEDYKDMDWAKETAENLQYKIKAYEQLIKIWFKGDN